MNALAGPEFDLAHRTGRVTNISPASDAFVLFTLFTLFFTLACFALWMWVIWRKGQKRRAEEQHETALDRLDPGPVAHLRCEDSGAEEEQHGAPWEKPADWWKQ